MPRTVADRFADILGAAGTERAYGIVGSDLNGPHDALRRQDKVGSLHVQHEDVAA